MAVAKWAPPSTRGSNIASTFLDSLANGSESAAISYDNGTNRDLYASVTVKLGSITPATGGSITLRVYTGDGTDVPNIGGSAFDSFNAPLTTTASAKVVVFPLVRLYPMSNMRFTVVNTAGVSTAASGNEFYVRPYNEDVS
jgi:hypothetical protein